MIKKERKKKEKRSIEGTYEGVIESRTKLKAGITCLQATMATADELYSEYIPDVDMKKFGNDQQAANTVVNLITSELVAARTLTSR